LSDWNVDAVAAAGGAEALELASRAQRPFDLIISDGHMPVMDGFQFVRRLRSRQEYRATPILMLSSGTPEEANLARVAGANGHVLKPADRVELLEALLAICQAPVDSPAKAEPRAQRDPSRPSARILLVEDNLVNQKVATALLSKAGYSVVVAGDGARALELLGQQAFDVCLMDVQMPVMDGVAATAEIRRRENPRNRLPIIAMTANAMSGDRERYLTAGMDDYVSKPLDPRQLFATVERWLAASLQTEPA
jgi:CheY-like chemotaxis protein